MKRSGPINLRENQSRKRNTTRRVMTVLNELVNSEDCDKITQRANLSQNAKMNSNANFTKMGNCNEKDRDLSSSRIRRVYVRAKYEKDQNLQKNIILVKDRNAGQLSREINQESQLCRKSGRKTKKLDWFVHNVMIKTIDRGENAERNC